MHLVFLFPANSITFHESRRGKPRETRHANGDERTATLHQTLKSQGQNRPKPILRWGGGREVGVSQGIAHLVEKRGVGACSPELVTTSDPQHQSAPNHHGHYVEDSTGGGGLTTPRGMDQK